RRVGNDALQEESEAATKCRAAVSQSLPFRPSVRLGPPQKGFAMHVRPLGVVVLHIGIHEHVDGRHHKRAKTKWSKVVIGIAFSAISGRDGELIEEGRLVGPGARWIPVAFFGLVPDSYSSCGLDTLSVSSI